MKKKVLLALVSILTACKKESSYSTNNYICNNSNHSVKITYYKDGIIINNLRVDSISVSSCYLVHKSSGFGKGNASNYLNSTINLDSALVLFDNNTLAVHYGFNTIGSNTKAIAFGNPRNIFGGSSTGGWESRIVSETKRHIETELKYTFTEQDYLNPKEN